MSQPGNTDLSPKKKDPGGKSRAARQGKVQKDGAVKKIDPPLADQSEKEYTESKKTGGRTTPYDDTMRTMVQYSPQLVIPLINEALGIHLPDDTPVANLANEIHSGQQEVITDGQFLILDNAYHFEFQSTEDEFMAYRMYRYDFMISIRLSKDQSGYAIQPKFPRSFVLYLRENKNRPKNLVIDMPNIGGKYTVPVVCVAPYTKEEMLEKKLFLLLPFYIVRYEKDAKKLEQDLGKLNALVSEYEDILTKARRMLSPSGEN